MSESNFDKYIRKSSCNMIDCPYGYDLDCNECVSRMIAEHDAKIRADAIDFFKSLIIQHDEDYDKPTISMKFLNDYIEQMIVDGFVKEQKNDD